TPRAATGSSPFPWNRKSTTGVEAPHRRPARRRRNSGRSILVSNRHGIVDTIIDSLAPVNRDGHKFIAIAAGLALVFFLVWPPLAWVCVGAALYIRYFFSAPHRVTPHL